MRIKTYIINLKESVDRRNKILAEVAKYPFLDIELVEAVNGKEMFPKEINNSFNILQFIYRYMRTPKRGEIGCTLSHRECYRKFLASEEEFVLILEDDITFLYPSEVKVLLEDLAKKLIGAKAHFVTLGKHNIYYRRKSYQVGHFSFYKIIGSWGTYAYLINRKAAQKMLSISRPFIVADDYDYMGCIGIRTDGIYPTFVTAVSTMKTVIQDNNSEIISYSDIPLRYLLKSYWMRIYFWLLRKMNFLFYRQFVEGRNI